MPLPIWFIGMAAGAIGHMSAQKKQETAERLNREKPKKLWNGIEAKCDERIYFATEQEDF